MITCATWADIWLNEGFATFCEAFWKENTGGYSAYKNDILSDASYYLSNNPGWPISDSSWAVHTPNVNVLFDYSITYMKGASVLHQLRYVLGDSIFFATLKAYCADTNLKYKSASIADFNAKVNEVSGGNYNWFFNEWIFEPNHPVYQNTYNFENIGNGQWKVNFFMTQTQSIPAFFKMPVQVKIQFQDNTDTLINAMNDVNYQQFAWTFSKRPVFFQFDPDQQIVLKHGGTTVGISETNQAIGGVHLSQNIPNPAFISTQIVYEIDKPMHTQLDILDLMGNSLLRVCEGNLPAGKHIVNVDCSSLLPGIYFYQLKADGNRITKKLVITR